MEFLNVVENIEKLMKLNHYGITDLAAKSGITEVGLRKMLKTGAFKLESLSKIAQGLEIPMIVLLANKIIIKQTLLLDSEEGMFHNYNILWTGGFSTQSIDRNNNAVVHKIKINTEYYSEKREITDEFLVEGDGRELTNLRILTDSLEAIHKTLKSDNKRLYQQLEDKEAILEFIKRENLFAFSNIIRLLMENRQANDTGIAPEKLNDLTRSKIFDETFLKTLLDNGLISETDYQFFTAAKK